MDKHQPQDPAPKRRSSYKKMNMEIETSTPTKHAVAIEIVPQKQKAAAEILDKSRR